MQAWNITRTAQLQDELHGLQKSFEEINKKFGLDMLDGLDDFEFAVSYNLFTLHCTLNSTKNICFNCSYIRNIRDKTKNFCYQGW